MAGEEAAPGKLVQVGPCGRDIDEATARRAADVIRAGGVVALPTDTLYGVACDAWNAEALGRLYGLKGRSEAKPVAIVVARHEDVESVAECPPGSAPARVTAALLPGPFTVVLPRGASLPPELNPGTDTIGVRVVPASSPCATAICSALGPRSALALTSANLSGSTSPLQVADFADLVEGLDLVLDGGEIPAGSRAGSTVVLLGRPGEFAIARDGVAGGRERATAAAEAAGLRLAGAAGPPAAANAPAQGASPGAGRPRSRSRDGAPGKPE